MDVGNTLSSSLMKQFQSIMNHDDMEKITDDILLDKDPRIKKSMQNHVVTVRQLKQRHQYMYVVKIK